MATKKKKKAKAPRKANKKARKRSAARKTKRSAASTRRDARKKAVRGKKVSARRSVRKTAGRGKARKVSATKARRAVKARERKPAKKSGGRLAPSKRHVVERDEARERIGEANEKAFVGADTSEDEAKEMGEEFVRSVTSGEEAESEMEEEEATEEQGGPFVVTSASTEYGFGTDESNPVDAEKAPFPQVSPAASPKLDSEDEDQ
jgi:hypothetical protein